MQTENQELISKIMMLFNKAYLNTAGVRAVTVLNGNYKSGQGGYTSTEFRYSWVPDISC